MTAYQGYLLDKTAAGVAVHDPRFPDAPALYRGSDLNDAKGWVRAYRAGRSWAVQAILDDDAEMERLNNGQFGVGA